MPGKGLTFSVDGDSFEMNKHVCFGDHLMSVLQTLGNPNKEYYKAQKLFLNYLELGIDIMFEHQELVVTKLIIHLN